jgi:hypothetical protein
MFYYGKALMRFVLSRRRHGLPAEPKDQPPWQDRQALPCGSFSPSCTWPWVFASNEKDQAECLTSIVKN